MKHLPNLCEWVHHEDSPIVYMWLTDYDAWWSYIVVPGADTFEELVEEVLEQEWTAR